MVGLHSSDGCDCSFRFGMVHARMMLRQVEVSGQLPIRFSILFRRTLYSFELLPGAPQGLWSYVELVSWPSARTLTIVHWWFSVLCNAWFAGFI